MRPIKLVRCRSISIFQTRTGLQSDTAGAAEDCGVFLLAVCRGGRLVLCGRTTGLTRRKSGELREFIDLSMKNIGKYNQTVNNMSIKGPHHAVSGAGSGGGRPASADVRSTVSGCGGEMMQEVYAESYYRIWYNIDQYRGFHAAFAQIDPHAVETLLEYPFNGADFPAGCGSKGPPADAVDGVPDHYDGAGKNPQSLAADFAKKDAGKNSMLTGFLQTESSFLMSAAAHAGYKEDGVEKYQILATLDSKTCGVCGELDGKIYPVEEAVTGKNMPPFIAFCRCTDVPYYDDMDLSDTTRVAREPETGEDL